MIYWKNDYFFYLDFNYYNISSAISVAFEMLSSATFLLYSVNLPRQLNVPTNLAVKTPATGNTKVVV